MAKKQQIEFLHPNVLLVVTTKGIIIELFTPIRAEVVSSKLKKLPKGTKVYIDAIVKDPIHRILYYIGSEWYPYNYFRVGS
jgi:hypothetical protein